jgi:hypothetical protein
VNPATTPNGGLGQTWDEVTADGTYTWTDRNRDVWWKQRNPAAGDAPTRIGRAGTLAQAERLVRRHQRQRRAT